MIKRWDYTDKVIRPFGSDESYRVAIEWLDIGGTIADWGCGARYAEKFVKSSRYVGIDFSPGLCDLTIDLDEFVAESDCILMRHVLEHNYKWYRILNNAIDSYKRRFALVIFTPLQRRQTVTIYEDAGGQVPEISFEKFDLEHCLEPRIAKCVSIVSEHIFLCEK